MPRKDGNNPSRNPRHHKLMHSAAKGQGHDAKRRARKHNKTNN